MRTAPIITTTGGTRFEAFGPVEWGLVAAIAGVWGSSFLLMTIGLEALRPGLVTLLHIAIGASALSLFPGARRRVDREDLPRIGFLGAVWIAIPLTLIALAQQWVASSAAGMINGAGPLFSALFAALLLRRPPGPLQALGLLVGFAGVLIVSLVVAEGGTSSILGILLLLVATVLFGLSANIAVPLQQRYGALPVVWRAQLVAVALVLPYGVASISDSGFDAASLWAVLVLGLGATGLGFALMAILVGRAGATRGSVVIYFLPVVATLLGIAFRDENVGAVGAVGLTLIVAGASLTSRGEAPPAANGKWKDDRHPDPGRTRRRGAGVRDLGLTSKEGRWR